MRRLIALIAVLYVLSEAFDSVIRWLFNLAHVDELIYVRDLGLVVIVVAGFAVLFADERNVLRIFWLLCALVIGGCIGLVSGLSIVQMLFGLKIWLPFVAGFMLIETGAASSLLKPKSWMLLWAILCLGVIFNEFYHYPWMGLMTQLGDIAVTGNREWSAGGIQRLSGFSRSSYDAAILILILYLYLMLAFRGFAARLALIALSGAAIVMTTCKGVVAVFAATLLLMPILGLIKGPREWLKPVAVAGLLSIAAVGIVAPLVSLQVPFPQLREGTTEYWLFASLMDRAWDMWPRSLALVSDWQIILGRGIGGIGTPQYNFEPGVASAADSFFVYLYVTAGLLGALFYGFFAYESRLLSLQDRTQRTIFLVLFCIFGYGLTANIIENAVLSLVLGGIACFLLAFGEQPSREALTHAAAASPSIGGASPDFRA